ncbi:MAG: phosphoglucosamine mutase [Planctomycetota bacterium]|jgi:phosphomannomutase
MRESAKDMTAPLIISVSGLRGIVGESLTEAVAYEYGQAFGMFLQREQTRGEGELSVCLGRDSRPSGQMLKSAVSEGLCAAGISVIDLGVVTTPGVGIMVRELECSGGVVITASHNPGQYNGIKLVLGNAIAPPTNAARQIRQFFLDKNFCIADSSKSGRVTYNDQTDIVHIAKVLALVDKETIAARKLRVVLDSVNGAGGRVTKKMLAELGCEVIAINDEPTGVFAHAPEPTAENITTLCEVVKGEKAAIGFAQDPDADRLAIVDENGAYIGEEYTLALAAKYIFSKKTGNAATNLSTSRMIEDIAEKAEGQVIRTPVGEANVAAAMLEHNCIIGGEGNGGVIDLRVSPIRDSLVGIALILQLLTETGKTVSQLGGAIGGYYMSKEKFAANESQVRQILDSAKKLFADAKLDGSDGCRFDFDDGWLHLRASNTEPVMRLIVEAKDRQTAEKYIDAVWNIRRQILG